MCRVGGSSADLHWEGILVRRATKGLDGPELHIVCSFGKANWEGILVRRAIEISKTTKVETSSQLTAQIHNHADNRNLNLESQVVRTFPLFSKSYENP
jgi:hypothetical protein